jgi:hypothetical protein
MRYKTVTFLCIAVVWLASGHLQSVTAAGSGTFTIGTATDVNVGDVVTIPVKFASLTLPTTTAFDGSPMAHYQSKLTLSFSPQDLALIASSEYSVLNQYGNNPNSLPLSVTSSTGIITVFPLAYIGTNGAHPPTSGDIMVLQFKVLRSTDTAVSWVPSLTHFSYTYANAPIEWNPIQLSLVNGRVATKKPVIPSPDKPTSAPASPSLQTGQLTPTTQSPTGSRAPMEAQAVQEQPGTTAGDQDATEEFELQNDNETQENDLSAVQSANQRLTLNTLSMIAFPIAIGVVGGIAFVYRHRLLERLRSSRDQ